MGRPESAKPGFARCYLAISRRAEARGVREHRRALLAWLSGVVCEVGTGPGLTFALYPSTVTRVLAVEPEPTLRRHSIAAAAAASVPVEVVDGVATALPMADGGCDAVVTSLVLCSVPDQGAALAEMRRVLRPGGELRFYEHVRSPHRLLAAAEDLVVPVWSRLAGGCHPNRDSVAAIRNAGFEMVSVRTFGVSPLPGIPPFAHALGRAIRP